MSTSSKWCKPVSLFTLCLSVLTEEFRGSVFEGLPEIIYKRRCAGWRREAGKKHVALHIFTNEVLAHLVFPASQCCLFISLLFFSISDLQQMQSQAEVYQKVQHSKVPTDSRASYPFLESLQFLCLCARHRDVHMFILPTRKKKQRLWWIRSCWESSFPAHWEINVRTVECN